MNSVVFIFLIKKIVLLNFMSIISRYSQRRDGNVRFTTVSFEPYIDYQLLCALAYNVKSTHLTLHLSQKYQIFYFQIVNNVNIYILQLPESKF